MLPEAVDRGNDCCEVCAISQCDVRCQEERECRQDIRHVRLQVQHVFQVQNQ